MNIEIANRLVALRKENGLSQEELAAKLGISRQAVSKWERAESSPDTDNLIALARLYNVSLDAVLSLDTEGLEDAQFAQSVKQDTAAKQATVPPAQAEENAWKRFPYPVLVVFVYLLLGMLGGWWHPGWMVFLTIPIYYGIVDSMKS